MKASLSYNAIYTKAGKWYLGWVEELPGVNTQGKTLKETKANLREALELILKTNRALMRKSLPRTRLIRESIIA